MNPPDKSEVKASYDDLGGELYELRYREEQNRKYDAALLAARPRGDGLALDDGCGTGMLLSRLDSPAVGLDLSPVLLGAAKARLRADHHLVAGDAEHLPFRGDVFDAVYAMTLIQNVPNKRLAVAEMARVAKRRGRVLVTALKAFFGGDFLPDLLEASGLMSAAEVGDAATNDWIALAEKG